MENLIYSVGLDNTCSIYHLGSGDAQAKPKELMGHDGYISSCRFISENNVLTSSGDTTCNYWDLDRLVTT